jgi:NTE family protein
VLRLTRHLLGEATALVLSGGGARGFAHLGVVRALREANVPIDAIGGTSIGAIMGAGVALEWSLEEMRERFARTFVASNPLGDYTLPLVSLVAGRRVGQRLKNEFGEVLIDDLAVPYFCVSANLSSGQANAHRSGLLWQALRASISIPGVLPPVLRGGEVYVDGGVINNLPVDLMSEQHAGSIIGVDVGTDRALKSQFDELMLPPWWRLWPQTRKRERPSILGVLLRSGMVNSGAAAELTAARSTLLIRPKLADVDMLDWRAFDRAIELGYRAAVASLEER